MSTPVEQIKEKLSIVDVIGAYVKLEKAGISYKALCPFHKERTPSFNVSPTRDAFYCFGCNKGGDIFTFIEEIEGVSFPEALRLLADRAGVTLPKTTPQGGDERDRLRDVLESAAVFFQKNLIGHAEALRYLRGRGLKSETMKAFRLGYAPDDFGKTTTHLRSLGYTEPEILAAGLAKAGDRGLYDRFRGRIMFPIRDISGRVVAFTGRTFGARKNPDGTDPAKYLNSPDGPLYDKSAILFAYDSAKKTIRERNFAIVVEGQMDCLMAHQAGDTNTVAVSGTALTEKHLALIRRLTENIVFTLDADDAGFTASTRAPTLSIHEMFEISVRGGSGVRIASIPQGKDPADLIALNPDAWTQAIKESKWVVDYYIDELTKRNYSPEKLREEMLRLVVPLILAIPNRVVQKEIIEVTGRRTGMEQSIWEEVVRRIGKEAPGSRGVVVTQEVSSLSHGSLRRITEEHILGIILWEEAHKEPIIDGGSARTRYGALMAEYGAPEYTPDDGTGSSLAIRAEQTYPHTAVLEDELDELFHTLESELLKEKQNDLWRKIADAESMGDRDGVVRWTAAYQEITPRRIQLENKKKEARPVRTEKRN